MMIQHHTAPPGCATCGHLQRSTVQIGPIVDRNDFCSHPTGAKPMHTPCAWHSDGAVMRIDGNRV